MSFKNPVGIIAANRLPIGKINGFYKKISPETLYQNLIKQQFNKNLLLKKADIDWLMITFFPISFNLASRKLKGRSNENL